MASTHNLDTVTRLGVRPEGDVSRGSEEGGGLSDDGHMEVLVANPGLGVGDVSEEAGGGRLVVGAAARPADRGGGEKARPAPVETAGGGQLAPCGCRRLSR